MIESTEGSGLGGLAAMVSWRSSLARAAVRSQLFEDIAHAPCFGRYRWVRPLGQGGMGTVVVAFDPLLGREVAVKLVDADDPSVRARVVREAQANARVNHPNVVAVYDVGVEDERVYIVTELVVGEDLRAWITTTPGWREIVEVYLAAGEGLAAVHASGLVHRDFKPANVVIGADARARLIDFGIARALPVARGSLAEVGDGEEVVVTLEDRAGTPAYLAPEQLFEGAVDARADQFSFCVALWEALAGARPGGTAAVFGIVEGTWPPAPPQGGPVPAAIWRALARGLAESPAERHPDMAGLLGVLRRATRARRRRIAWVVGLGALAIAGLSVPSASADASCVGVGDPGAALWDPQTRAASEQHLIDAGTELTAAAWPRVDAALGEYAKAWQRERSAACAAAGGPDPDAEPARCFAWGLTSAQQLVADLGRADAAATSSLLDRALTLPAPARCRDPIALAALPPLPPADVREAVEAARASVQEIDRSLRSADHAGALAQAQAVEATALTLAFAPLSAEVALRIGRAHAELGAWSDAREAFLHSHTLAESIGYAAVASESAAALATLLAKRLHEPDDASTWSRRALAAARATADDALVIEAESSIAGVEVALGRWPEARGLFEGLGARLRQTCATPCAPLVDVEIQLSFVDGELGDFAASTSHARAGVALAETVYGPLHPITGAAHNQLCIALDTDRIFDEARTECLASHRVARAVFGDDHAETATSLAMLATVENSLGERDLARRELDDAYRVLARTLGPDHPTTIAAISNRGLMDRDAGEFTRAEQAFATALAALLASPAPDPLALATLHHNEATALVDLERDAEAVDHLQQTITLRTAAGVHGAYLAMTRTQLGGALWRLGRLAEAQDVLEQALATEPDDDTEFNRAVRRYYLAEAVAKSDRARAMRLVVDAQRRLQTLDGDDAGVGVECDALVKRLTAS